MHVMEITNPITSTYFEFIYSEWSQWSNCITGTGTFMHFVTEKNTEFSCNIHIIAIKRDLAYREKAELRHE